MRRTTLLTIIYAIVIYTTAISCKEESHYAPERIKGEIIPVNQNSPTSEEIIQAILPYKEAIQAEMDSVLAIAPASYTKKDGKLNTAVGNMMADAIFSVICSFFFIRMLLNVFEYIVSAAVRPTNFSKKFSIFSFL